MQDINNNRTTRREMLVACNLLSQNPNLPDDKQAMTYFRSLAVIEIKKFPGFKTANNKALCSPLFRALRYLPLPRVNEAANFAYISFFICRENDPALERVLLGEISAAARNYDFLTIGAANRSSLWQRLNSVKGIKFTSRLCTVDYNRSNVMENAKMPFRFECALL
jgi:hypothetical protein